MSQSDFYPDVNTGDTVLFATNPKATDAQFRLGIVSVAKLDSCDIIVYGPHGGEARHDVLHVDDPRCQKVAVWNEPGRGIFKLSQREVDRRRDHEDRLTEQVERCNDRAALARAMERVAVLETNLEALVLQQQRRGPFRQRKDHELANAE